VKWTNRTAKPNSIAEKPYPSFVAQAQEITHQFRIPFIYIFSKLWVFFQFLDVV